MQNVENESARHAWRREGRLSGQSLDVNSPILRYKTSPILVTHELADSVRKRFPIEGLILDICLMDGRAVLINEKLSRDI